MIWFCKLAWFGVNIFIGKCALIWLKKIKQIQELTFLGSQNLKRFRAIQIISSFEIPFCPFCNWIFVWIIALCHTYYLVLRQIFSVFFFLQQYWRLIIWMMCEILWELLLTYNFLWICICYQMQQYVSNWWQLRRSSL